MCLAAFAVGICDSWPLVVAANRDESHRRPSAPAAWWENPGGILGGRDLQAGGGWLAVDPRGRLAAVTNIPAPRDETLTGSRGHLVSHYLMERKSPQDYCRELAMQGERCGPYNLILFDGRGLFHSANRSPAQRLARGIYVMSNAPLGTPWPKVEFAATRLAALLESAPGPQALTGKLFELLEYGDPLGMEPDATELHWRTRQVFVRDAHYGTRASTVVLLGQDGDVEFTERRYRADGGREGNSSYRFSTAQAGEMPTNR